MTEQAILAVDPGTYQSAWVLLEDGTPARFGLDPNDDVVAMLSDWHEPATTLVVEMVASYGMPVGCEVFETCVWIGRFIQAWDGFQHRMMYRREVKLHLCGSMRAKDSNVRRALLDKFPRGGGGKTPQVGTKKQPGPLYGFKSDLWAALAVAVTYRETDR